MTPEFKKKLWIIFGTALALRLLYIFALPPRPMNWDDSTQWNKTAIRFLDGAGFLTQTEDLDPKRPPVYPLFLAGIYSVAGRENYTAVKVTQAAIASLTCLIWMLAARFIFSEWLAFRLGLFLALYPPLIVYSEVLQSETVFILMFAAFFWSWFRGNRSVSGGESGKGSEPQQSWKYFAACGLLLGLMNLCKGSTFLFPFWLVFLMVIPTERIKWKQYIVMAALSFMVIAPWMWRNHKVYGGWIPTAAGGPEQFWSGTLPWAEQRLFGNSNLFREFDPVVNVLERERSFRESAVANIKADPGAYARLTVRKFFFWWFQPVGQNIAERKGYIFGIAFYAWQVFLICFFLWGVFKTRVRWKELLPFYLMIAYLMCLHVAMAPEPRYRLPIEPILILLMLAGLNIKKSLAAHEQ